MPNEQESKNPPYLNVITTIKPTEYQSNKNYNPQTKLRIYRIVQCLNTESVNPISHGIVKIQQSRSGNQVRDRHWKWG